MKKNFCLIAVIIFFSGISSLSAQSNSGMLGTEFWLTFGQNYNLTSPNSDDHDFNIDLQIRIVGGASRTNGYIRFTSLGYSVNFTIEPQQVYTYSLNSDEKEAVYNTLSTQGGTSNNHSIRITSNAPVTVYALNQALRSTDATNILPVTALGTEYHHISYAYSPLSQLLDAYAVVATQNNTRVYHNGILEVTLNTGQVYYRTFATDATGSRIIADKPIAFFAVHQGAQIPAGIEFIDHLMQQLTPIRTWGRNFFVPVSHRARDIVRIVAAQDNTNITQIGGTVIAGNLTLNTGQYVELRIELENNGCYIQADKPVGVCAYLTGGRYNEHLFGDTISDPAQTWLPSLEQMTTNALVAPFIPEGVTALFEHHVLLLTPTATKENTLVSIGGAPSNTLSGGSWVSNEAAGMSFYNMPLTNAVESYYFMNPEGIIVLCYGVGTRESYYYLGAASMKTLNARFFANDIYYQNLPTHRFCTNEIELRGEVEGDVCQLPGFLKWYIDGTEEVIARDQWTWNKIFPTDEYEIEMYVRFADGDTVVIKSTLKIGDHISTMASPPQGGSTTGDGCYNLGDEITITATPNFGYIFLHWELDGNNVSTDNSYTFTVTEYGTFIAHFEWNLCEIILSANPPEGGIVSGEGVYERGTEITISAVNSIPYSFINWTEGSTLFSTDAFYTFIVMESHTLVANFERPVYTVNASANNDIYGYTTGSGKYDAYSIARIEALGNDDCYRFTNWTINGVEVSTDNPYEFVVTEDTDIVANFYALDFDTYSPTLWNNTFMLDLRKLANEGYEVNGCQWFKNGILEKDTRTIDEFSYSAGPHAFDLLEPAPTYYMFLLSTEKHGNLCSTHKLIDDDGSSGDKTKDSCLFVYPNPVLSGSPFTIEGVVAGDLVKVYNQSGIFISSVMATGSTVTLTLHLPAGIYFIRANNREIKIVII